MTAAGRRRGDGPQAESHPRRGRGRRDDGGDRPELKPARKRRHGEHHCCDGQGAPRAHAGRHERLQERARRGRRRHGEGRRGHPQEGASSRRRRAPVASRPRARSPRGSRRTASAASSSRSTARRTSSSRGDDFKGFVKNVARRREQGAARAPISARRSTRAPTRRSTHVRAGARRPRPARTWSSAAGPRSRRRSRAASSTPTCTRAASSPSSSTPRRPTPKNAELHGLRRQRRDADRGDEPDRRPQGRDHAGADRQAEGDLRRRSSRKRPQARGRRGRRSSRARSPSGSPRSRSSGRTTCGTRRAGTIDKIRQELGKKLGGEVKIHGFVRFALGEGIEKKTRGPRRRGREDDRRLSPALERRRIKFAVVREDPDVEHALCLRSEGGARARRGVGGVHGADAGAPRCRG